MRSSDWSSDVCSSELRHKADARVGLVIIRKGAAAGVIDFVRQIPHPAGNVPALVGRGPTEPGIDRCESLAPDVIFDFGIASEPGIRADPQRRTAAQSKPILGSSEERRVGKARVSKCSFRWSPY